MLLQVGQAHALDAVLADRLAGQHAAVEQLAQRGGGDAEVLGGRAQPQGVVHLRSIPQRSYGSGSGTVSPRPTGTTPGSPRRSTSARKSASGLRKTP